MIATGLDRLLGQAEELASRRYGLLAHAASVTADLRLAHLALTASAAGPPAALFAPEHGFYAIEQDMVANDLSRDPWTGAPIVSLYGDDASTLRPRPEAFRDLDLLVVDLQDVGARYYTYAATAVWAAEVALAQGLEVWVLDRPNPLGGEIVEGNRPQRGFESFVSAFRIPVRHGLTLGELVRLEARRRCWSREPRIWELHGWRRSMWWSDLERPWIAPSPNIPTAATAEVYPGMCLVEGTTLSEGRGTTRPFQLVGAPGLDPPALAEALTEIGLPGVTFVPTYFRPQFQKHRGRVCGGVELVVTDARAFPAYRCGVELLATVKSRFPEVFGWRAEPYEFVGDRPAIDLLTSGDELRRALDSGAGPAAWLETWPAAEEAFREERQSVLLYG